MTVTVEILKEEAMSLLLNLERLKVLQLVPAKKKAARNGKAPAKEVKPLRKSGEEMSFF